MRVWEKAVSHSAVGFPPTCASPSAHLQAQVLVGMGGTWYSIQPAPPQLRHTGRLGGKQPFIESHGIKSLQLILRVWICHRSTPEKGPESWEGHAGETLH